MDLGTGDHGGFWKIPEASWRGMASRDLDMDVIAHPSLAQGFVSCVVGRIYPLLSQGERLCFALVFPGNALPLPHAAHHHLLLIFAS